ncbi:protein lin-54 homolog isoform X2 [Oppia nitens]|uniref:protein lin-54 homolog isoform X2 n=1 Tax=Oppia nitens TaxID=1686743 RepID=UPI0023DC039A|nr:protein lin-54 homolog isoform X2 [Oppia nitens]
MALLNQRSGQSSSTTAADNDLAFTSQDLSDLAARIGADFTLPEEHNLVDEFVNNDILVNVDQSQVIDDKSGNNNNANDVDMDTIVIETINDVDMNDAIVFDNVGNEVSISSTNQFSDRQYPATAVMTKSVTASRGRRGTGGQAKIRPPNPQQIIPISQATSQFVKLSASSQPQIIPLNALSLSQLSTSQVLTTTSPIKLQSAKNKAKKVTNVTTVSSNQISNDTSTVKVIYTSQGQQIVFSPSKQTQSLSSVMSMPTTTGVAPPGKVLLRPIGQAFSKTGVNTNQNQPQQVIILSPVKTSTTGVTTIAPAGGKILPVKSGQQFIAAKSPQRILAPAPTQPKIAISKASNDAKPVQLIRVVPISSAQSPQFTSISSNKLVPLRSIAPNTSVRAIAPITQSPATKLIVPTSGVKVTSGSLVVSTAASTVSQTAYITTPGTSNSGQVFMLPNPSLLKMTPTTTITTTTPTSAKSVTFATSATQRTNYVPIAPSPMTTTSTVNSLTAAQIGSLKISNGSTKPAEDPNQRKPCNCTKSQCLKLYCDCFANGEFCSSCNCISCHNNLDHEEDRQKAIRQCLERNPHAFHPKIGKGRAGDTERRHTKGCNCRRSGCLKNYCECYEAKILCSGLCKCVGCKNFEESFERKTLMHLADAAEVRSAQQNAATKNRLWSSDFKPKLPIRVDGDRLPCSFITAEVVEATCQCLLAQAEHGERVGLDIKHIEKLVIEEFGRCLTQIIDCAAKTRNAKFKTEIV